MTSPDAVRLPIDAFPITLVVNPGQPDRDENMQPIGLVDLNAVFLEVRRLLREKPVALLDSMSPFYGPEGPWRFSAIRKQDDPIPQEGFVRNSLTFGPEGAPYFAGAEGEVVRFVAVDRPMTQHFLMAAVEQWLNDILPSTADFAVYEQAKADALRACQDDATARRGEELENLEAVLSHARHVLESALSTANIDVHSVTGRIKSDKSIREKIGRHEEFYAFENLGDVVGLRVVCVVLADLELVAEVIRETFDVLSVENKVAGSAVDSFGYMSVHHNVRVPWDDETPEALRGRSLEIQVRTILMDAWANVSHVLDYNTERRIPGRLRRDFHALSGSLYTADLQFETLFREVQDAEEKARALVSADAFLDVDTLGPYLAKKFEDRRPCRPDELPQLTELLFHAGCETVGDVEALLERTARAVGYFEREFPPPNTHEYGESVEPGRYSAAGVVRASVELVRPRPVRMAVSASMPFRHLVDPP